MQESFLERTLAFIAEEDPMHFKKLRKTLDLGDDIFMQQAEAFFSKYQQVLFKLGKDFDFALGAYVRFCNDMRAEQVRFQETGNYSNTSFAAVSEQVYANPAIMEYHMHGLLMSQFLWAHHYRVFRFFSGNLARFAQTAKAVLEVGGGHGLYTNEAMSQLTSIQQYDVVDISSTSLYMSRAFVQHSLVSYHHADIFGYQPEANYDLIIMGEVLEHVETPELLMRKLHQMGAPGAFAFITVPFNAPAIDHIYLFRSADEIRQLYATVGWTVALDLEVLSEAGTKHASANVPGMYAAFLKKSL